MKTIKWSLGVLALLAVLVGGYVLYELWRYEVFKTPVYETAAPELPELKDTVKVLVFSKTNNFRHLEAIPAAEKLLQSFAEKNEWDIFITENGAVHNPEQLKQFDIVVWNNVTGDVLLDDQRKALRSYMEAGGKFLGLHGTGGNPEYKWGWFPEQMIKARFTAHPMFPQFRDAHLIVEDRKHPATRHMPERVAWNEEWYSFEDNPRNNGANILIRVDEEEYDVPEALKMGADHPLVWHHTVGGGKVFYTALGHQAEAYDDPLYQTFLENAMHWLLQN
ncbi:ThuA domain-containing protein [Parendozoicomonas haliclonae]|uniref:Trehalose utilization n=2 Tax=Parendozoicomonas haliclonae TaxID=1960125 RepID=A0A1X7AG04_9GAMM|nr:ThuA domain-containing protein [Parendozoicomonas haliclonae]SMA38986.1 Trehalose utilization [Parendozoicomonas haliclonae]